MIAIVGNAEKYDPLMEILCTIPVAPDYVVKKFLMDDFGFKTQSDLDRKLNILCRRGYDLVSVRTESGNGVQIAPSSRTKTVSACVKYWDLVHGV
jgi:hypothetical protein